MAASQSHAPAARLGALDSLRGWAIVLVIAVHVAGWIPPTTAWLRTTAAYGGTGVTLFFIVSAFSLLYAREQREKQGQHSLVDFYARRVLRIMPMLWFAMGIYLHRSGMGPRDWAPNGIIWWDVLLVALGLNGWHPYQINAVIPIGWTIGVEFSFYLIFPVIALLIRSATSAFVAMVLALAAAHLWVSFVVPWSVEGFAPTDRARELYPVFIQHMSLPPQLPVFIAGFFVFFVWPKLVGRAWVSNILLAAFVSLYAALVTGRLIAPASMIHYTAMMACLALSQMISPHALIDNAVMRSIGKVSYSAYLLHMWVIYGFAGHPWATAAYPLTGDWTWLAGFVLVLLVTVAISAVTYKTIELPAMQLGGRLLRKRRAAELLPRPLHGR